MTMDIHFVQDNYRVLRAAWTAMDQTYGAVQQGRTLAPIDHAGQGEIQPFSAPEGFSVATLVSD